MTSKIGRLVLSGLIIMTLFTACETTGPKTAIGGLGGATVGGLLAAAVGGDATGIAAGTILGGLIGGAIGSGLDAQDRQYAQQAAHQAFEYVPSGTSVPWHNPDSGHSGQYMPTYTYRSAEGYCREYQQTVIIDGRQQASYGTACRQPDGSWQIVN